MISLDWTRPQATRGDHACDSRAISPAAAVALHCLT